MKLTNLYAVAVTLNYSLREKGYYFSVEISENSYAKKGMKRYIYEENCWQTNKVNRLYNDIYNKVKHIIKPPYDCGKRVELSTPIPLGKGYIVRDYPVEILIYKTPQKEVPVSTFDCVILDDYGEEMRFLLYDEMVRRIIIGRKLGIYHPIRCTSYSKYMPGVWDYTNKGICPPIRGKVFNMFETFPYIKETIEFKENN